MISLPEERLFYLYWLDLFCESVFVPVTQHSRGESVKKNGSPSEELELSNPIFTKQDSSKLRCLRCCRVDIFDANVVFTAETHAVCFLPSLLAG